jgi:hypothetical protein
MVSFGAAYFAKSSRPMVFFDGIEISVPSGQISAYSVWGGVKVGWGATGAAAIGAGAPDKLAPQLSQKADPGGFAALHAGHSFPLAGAGEGATTAAVISLPQLSQNLLSEGLSFPHFGQFIFFHL